MAALFEDARGGAKSSQDVRGEMRTLRQATDEKVKQTVDSQQYAAWSTMREEQGPSRGGN